MELRDSVAVVTGAGRNIGRATAAAFSRAGADVVVVDVDDEAGQETADAITHRGGRSLFLHADLASREAVESVVAEAINWRGH